MLCYTNFKMTKIKIRNGCLGQKWLGKKCVHEKELKTQSLCQNYCNAEN